VLESFLPEMRDFAPARGKTKMRYRASRATTANAYLADSALAVSMARLVDPAFPLRPPKLTTH
jgi:hypothetical protein